MNVKKIESGNIEQAYNNIMINENEYRRGLQSRKSPLNKNALRNTNYYSFNRSPPPLQRIQDNYYYQNNPRINYINKYDTEVIKLEENININDYLNKNKNKKRIIGRSPINYNYNQIQQTNNYYNYNRNNNNMNKNKVLKQFESDEFDYNDMNDMNYQYSDDNINNDWKNKILKINEQKANYEYFDKNKYSNNTNKNRMYLDENYSQNDYDNQILSQSVSINLPGQNKNFNNYRGKNNYNNFNKNYFNLSNDDYKKKYSQDYNVSNVSDTSFKNQTFQNNYYTNYNNFPNFNLNNDSSSSNFYDDSYELNKTENYTKKLKNKFSDLSKFMSLSSHENTSFEYNNNDDNYNTVAFRRPMKNDEEHYHQNLTIKINQKDEKKKKKGKKEKINVSARQSKEVKYVDNTPEGCNISTNTDINKIKEKKITNFRINPKEKKVNKYNNFMNPDLNYSNYSENYNDLSSTTMFIPPRKMKNYYSFNNPIINDHDYVPNANNKQLKNNQSNNNVYFPEKEITIKSRQLKGRSPQNYNSFNNNINTSKFPLKNRLYNNQNNYENIQNKTQDDIYNKKKKINLDKKIKEITVDLSPRKKIFDLSNSNGNFNNKINNITPNYNNNINEINTNNYNDKFNFNNNIKPKPKSKIESCIITFDKPKRNINNSYDKQYKLSSSLDNFKYNKIKYVKKKIPMNNNISNNNNLHETPGSNIINATNKNNFIYNKNRSAKKIYQKPGKRKLSSSFGHQSPKDIEKNDEVIDYCAPSPDYGKREKNINDNLYSDISNHSPLLVSGTFKAVDNIRKEQISPYSQKYDEFSFKEKINNNNNNINEINYSNTKPIKVKIINNDNNNTTSSNNNKNNSKIKTIYMKKTKTTNNVQNNNIIFASQRIPTFSNMEEIIKDNNKTENNDLNKINNQNMNDKKINGITPFGINEETKNKNIKKLIIKSFSNRKKEIKEKPKIQYSFYKKYYQLYTKQPQKELMYISKTKYALKPNKKPLLSINFISKDRYKYIYKLPISSHEYYTKRKIPNSLILPKIDVEYMTKIFIKNKEYIENKLNNIESEKMIKNNIQHNISRINKNANINIQNKPIKKRIILIRKTNKLNKKLPNNLNNENTNINENKDGKNEKNNNNENINQNINISTDINNINGEKNQKENDEYLQKNNENKEQANYLPKNNNIKNEINSINDKVFFKKKKINIIKREQLLPDNKKFDNENSFTSDDNLSFNLNINKELGGGDSKNNSKNSSRIFFFQKSIDNSTIKSQSNNTSINEGLNQSSSYANLMKASALNFSVIHNNLNYSINNDENSLSMISNNTINFDIDKHNLLKKKFKIRTAIRGVKKQSKHDFLKNYKHNQNLKISDILNQPEKTKKEIDKEKKINIIIKEDLDNYISFCKISEKNKKQKYNWSMIENLMIKIKSDIVDIIKGYLKSCDELIEKKKDIHIANQYIKNIIHHYKYNYLTSKNINSVHNKLLQLYLSIKEIKIYDSIKFEILGKLLMNLIDNQLFFINDFYVFRQADEKTKSNFRKILIYCDNGKNNFSRIHI